jgi:UDP-2,4-diacetamido-2,4,6-trideoxy-beta-L-altropyranose hydrolase
MIVLRAAAGPADGFGHLMRCIALGEGLESRGVESVVLMTDNPVADADLDRLRRGVRVERVPATASLGDDAAATIAQARRRSASVIVTDVCTQRALAAPEALDDYHRRLREHVDFLAVFAAGAHLDPTADLVINPYRLRQLGHDGTSAHRVLRGPQYFVFRPEFVRAARAPRHIAAIATKVVVTVGGSDPAGLTLRIIDAVTGGDGLEVRVIVGPGVTAAQKAAIAGRTAGQGRGWSVSGPPEDLAEILLWADLAITGDGLTKYETAVTGTPSIIVARPDSDVRLNDAFASAGSTVCVAPDPNGEYNELSGVIRRLLTDAAARAEMSRRGRELTDGRGLERVLERLPLVNV